MPTKIEKDHITGAETTGHEWDGLKELNNPLPRWWLYVFYATVLFAVVWMILFPAIPGFRSHTDGLLGYTQRGAVERKLQEAADAQAQFRDQIAKLDIAAVKADPELNRFALAGGRVLFAENCAPCHQSGGTGARGYPNLADDDWIWGGKLTEIEQTIRHGIRSPNDDATRQSAMPRFLADGVLTPPQVDAVAQHVRSLSGLDKPNTEGARLFAENCAACHAENGKGNREVGAPNLADKIWLYGSDKEAVVQTISYAHAGVMPAWGARLDDATVKMLAIYVHALGGGE